VSASVAVLGMTLEPRGGAVSGATSYEPQCMRGTLKKRLRSEETILCSKLRPSR
jgi:hypothetical protein